MRRLRIDRSAVPMRVQDFFAMTCHEVRNPLNGTVGSLRLAAVMLKRHGETEHLHELRDTIDAAIVCSDHCLQVLANMTSLQRLETGLLDVVVQPVQLEDVFKTVAAIVQPQLQTDVALVRMPGSCLHPLRAPRLCLLLPYCDPQLCVVHVSTT